MKANLIYGSLKLKCEAIEESECVEWIYLWRQQVTFLFSKFKFPRLADCLVYVVVDL